jgi:hypothetical protein
MDMEEMCGLTCCHDGTSSSVAEVPLDFALAESDELYCIPVNLEFETKYARMPKSTATSIVAHMPTGYSMFNLITYTSRRLYTLDKCYP